MKKLFGTYGGVITSVIAVVCIIGVVALMFPGNGTGWMESSFGGLTKDFSGKVSYALDGPEIIDGAKQVYEVGQATPLSFRSNAPIDTFKEVRVDSEVVDSSHYTVTEGSTIVTFDDEYSAALSAGDHEVAIVSEDGTASTSFTIDDGVLDTLTAKTWNGLTSFSGNMIWTDGTTIYYSLGKEQYLLNDNTWVEKTWSGFSNIVGCHIWTDGTNIYYSNLYKQYVLNKETDTWVEKTWKGLTNFQGGNIWTDGTNIYYSSISEQYILKGNTWEPKTWKGLTSFDGAYIWTDGTNIYYSSSSKQYVLNGDTWETKTWVGKDSISGSYVWTDGSNTYYSKGTEQYILKGDTWEPKTWNGGLTSFDGTYIWTDGTNIYYSSSSKQYVFS